ncbi:HEAT repeat domain-containing protein [Treponema sp.]|uniref:HEAT repeat domain-containing protein n=1 Tax=Treponema sp. TaxID=166 RepID=UPI00298DA52E|nr:HEAT repeat domain-containing protein [Treponema sp.]MCQ2241064.1 HEAT repeat domain-containing protein [Treponema sp.]
MNKFLTSITAFTVLSSAVLVSQEAETVVAEVKESVEILADSVSEIFDGLEDEVDVFSSFDEDSDEPEEDYVLKAYNESKEKKEEKARYKYTKEKRVAAKKRPAKHESKNDFLDKSENYEEESNAVFKYGLESQISNLIDELIKNEDHRFVDQIYDLFYETKDVAVKDKIIEYFTKLKDPCLGDFACEVINDPYDTRKETVDRCFKYVSEAQIKESVPGLVDLVDKEEDDYFTGALTALGELGEKEEAEFLADYLDRDDLSVPQRQALMKVLGRIKAVETWDKIVEIAKNEDENSFVRMYAAEAIGAMEKPEGEEILIDLFESTDPNLRCYVVKGIVHFNDEKADKVIIQALRDSQYKVRIEAIEAVEKREMKEAVPYLVFRCKDKDELKNVKEKSYRVIAKLNTSEGNEYLISLLNDKKTGVGARAKVAGCLLAENNAGTNEVIELARSTLKSDVKYQKDLRYALGKEFAKYDRSEFAEICGEYLDSADVATQGTGLDMWSKGRYSSCRAKVEEIAQDAVEDEMKDEEKDSKPGTYKFGQKKKNANAKKAKKILEMDGNTVVKAAPAEKTDAVSGAAPAPAEPVSSETPAVLDTSNAK